MQREGELPPCAPRSQVVAEEALCSLRLLPGQYFVAVEVQLCEDSAHLRALISSSDEPSPEQKLLPWLTEVLPGPVPGSLIFRQTWP